MFSQASTDGHGRTQAVQRRARALRLFEREHRPAEWLLGSVFVAFGAALAIAVPESGGLAFDAALIRAVQEVDGVTALAWFFNDFLNTWAIPLAWLGCVWLYLAARRWDVAAYFALAFLVSPMTIGLKALVDRERPAGAFDVTEFPSDASFPSGHTTTAIGLFGSWFILAPYLVPARWVLPMRALSLGAVGLTAFFRMWTGAHWPSDVTGSVLFGFALLALLLAGFALAGQLHRERRQAA